ncbi:MAG: succinate--CoA ligase subunit alpha [Candidatus Marinimicrobia bacterium]|jgi:succinyl-CoA synthetase alpha subunit|nr:succinate--CoA ligase subunit alpha [Candidatus Neomarinimicrobiota bacterium]MBT4270760.1 succinate--CoA ligase subunit alpha [Candidatus Neomarinimicrobiota bacterium]MBT4809216.1 succinate--CoA ligase subunit alpha [Candidatus Neomarinimicrobiota bacterium]MBT6841680.1 succinate--CoA ligase subunit alpha [Candidatus Neomarinimicrobiota bacterium]MBT7496004.1 succinate--CoA ligase subunit alpha [Candidatus Neomarinimicrobiota bacterium]
MSILVNKDSRVMVQGITGSEGTFHATQMLEYGTNVVAGVTPGKGGQMALDGKVPVFNSVEEARTETNANVSIIFVPPPFAAEAIIEASDAGVELVVCITEGVPVHDMVKAKRIIDQNGTRLIGPNCPGIITVDECKLGIMPGFICKKGNIGVLSKSGTLTYEAIGQLVNVGLGQSTALGIGGDPIIGTSMIDALKLFEADPETNGVVLIGEIGGQMENEAARWIKENMTKPVVGFIAGQTAPPGRRMGHAGAIVSGGDDTAEAKMRIMTECGIAVCESVAEIGDKMKTALNNN